MSSTGDSQQFLKTFLLGGEFVDSEIQAVSDLAQQQEFELGGTILLEGATNDHLHLLLSGSVAVLRAGEKIASLSTPGDVLGEMSLVTGKPCAASIIAEGPVSLLSLDLKKVSALPASLRDRFMSATHKLFSVILAGKLASTNEKARLFEITNRELQRAQGALEKASSTQIDQMSQSQIVLLNNLDKMLQEDVDPLTRIAERLARKAPLPADVKALVSGIQKLSGRRAAFSTVSSTRSLNTVRVLLAEDNLDDQIHAQMALGGTGAKFAVVSDVESGKKALEEGGFDILCVSANLLDLVPLAKAKNPTIRCVFMTSDAISEHLATVKKFPDLGTILARHPEDRAFTARNMATTIQKLATGDLFGVQKYLSWGTEVREFEITGSDQRGELTDKVSEELQSMGVGRPLSRRCLIAAEELLMNAVYDAPHDLNGRPVYNHLERTVPVTLAPNERAIFRYACDGTLVAISVEDRFGALTKKVVLDYLDRCFTGNIAEKIENKGGGGNGLFQLIQSSSLVVFNVQPKVKTEVIALISTSVQFDKLKQHPSFHFFEA